MTSYLKNNKNIHYFFLSKHSNKTREQDKKDKEKLKKYNEEIDSSLISSTIDKTYNNLLVLNSKDRKYYLNNLKITKQFKSPHHYSSSVYLLENYIVRKNLKTNRLGYFLFKNEINALKRLGTFEHFPKLLGYDPKQMCIFMTFCGEQISRKNIPSDWSRQLDKIHQNLLSVNVNSNDMILRNVCVLNKRIYIIDFGLYSPFGSSIDETISKLRYDLHKISE